MLLVANRLELRMKMHSFSTKACSIVTSAALLLSLVGGSIGTTAYAESVTDNALGQISFPDTTSISNMVNITGNEQTLQFDNGTARLSSTGENGDVLFLYDENSSITANGVTSVDINTSDSWRCGVMIRSTDINNFTWIGFDNSTTLRIRENIGGVSSDILTTIDAVPTSFSMRVEYWNNDLQVYINDNVIYSGTRPRANETENSNIVEGKSGIMAWSIHDVAFDNLSIYSYAPTILDVTAEGATSSIDGHNISLLFPYGTDLSSISPAFTTNPTDGVSISPSSVQDFTSGTAVTYTLSLDGGGTNTYSVTAGCEAMSVYVNTFDGNGDAAVIQSMQNIGDTTNTITHTNSTVTVSSSSGNDLYIDTNSPSVSNGVATVDYANNSSWRSGIIIRATDSDNFTWVALESATSLRMRESINGVQRDIIQPISLPSESFTLKVYYHDDELLIFAGDQVLYNGVRPFKYGDNPLDDAPVSGKVGVMGWSVKDTTFDNLSVSAFVPTLVAASVVNGTGTISDHTVQLSLNEGTNLSSVEPSLQAFPSTSIVTPTGAQDFSTYEAQTQGITYAITVDENTVTYQLFASTQEDSLYTLSNDSMTVRFNKLFPAVYDYTLANASGSSFMGSDLTYGDSIQINETSYTPTVEFSTVGTDTVQYAVTLSNVTVGSVTGKTVSFICQYTLSNTDVIMRITNVSGDEPNIRFLITMNSPILTLSANADGAAITTGGSNGSGGDGGTTSIGSNSVSKSNLSYAFLTSSSAAATVYTQDQWNRPYSAKTIGSGSAKVGAIYSSGFQYRLADGSQPVKDSSASETEVIPYVQTVHICQDDNSDGSVTWQDAALWTRKAIPQMPESVRDFFNGGSWVQTHAAFPGNGNNGASAVNNYSGFTTVYSDISQLVEAQRQISNMTDGIGKTSFEVVGWNGRGHDYGWPSINEVSYNPALGTEEEFKAAQIAIKEYGGDLSFHTNMTDMCDNSETYLRGTTDSIYGNRNSSTGTVQYNSSVFGWTAYKNNHFLDLPFALNRENAFIGTLDSVGVDGRFYAPKFMYSDVMLDYPKGNYTATEEQYAKYRLVNHYESLGTNLATEYYYSEKRTGGLYLMKNYSSPNVVDQFINAGQTIFNDTRNVAVQAQDYIWADLYSDVNRDGNANIAASGTGNQLSTQHTELTFLLSYLNGFVGKNELVKYVDNGTNKYTLWSNDVKYAVNTSTSALTVTEGDVAIGNLKLSSGKISGDVFIPAYDGSSRIFTFSTDGGTKTWALPAYITASSFNEYRLTENGRTFIGTVNAVGGSLTLNCEAGIAYVLDYSDSSASTNASENLSLTAKVTASSNETRALWSSYITSAPIPSESLYVSKADNSAWIVSDDPVLKDLTTAMFATGDATKLRYFHFVISGFAADGVSDTYWMPESGNSHWINFTYPGARTISSIGLVHDSSIDQLSITMTGTKSNGETITLYSGSVGKSFSKTLDTPVTDIVSTKLTINSAADATIKLCEVNVMS